MQFSTYAILAVLASFTYAQTIQDELAKIPACGVTCIVAATQKAGCQPYDYACQCGSAREAITQNAIPCVASSCQPSDLAVITQASTEICRLALLENITGSAVASATSALASSISGAISSATSAAASSLSTRLSGTTTSAAASASRTANAADKARFGAAGVAVGMGAVFAVVAL